MSKSAKVVLAPLWHIDAVGGRPPHHKRQRSGDVRFRGWLCENTLARDCDSIIVSQKAPLGLQVVAFRSNFAG